MVAVAKQKPSESGFGERLRLFRERAGLTQLQLADAAGLRRLSVVRYESGSMDPTWQVVLGLAAALGVRPNDFEGGVTDQAANLPLDRGPDGGGPPAPPRPTGKRK